MNPQIKKLAQKKASKGDGYTVPVDVVENVAPGTQSVTFFGQGKNMKSAKYKPSSSKLVNPNEYGPVRGSYNPGTRKTSFVKDPTYSSSNPRFRGRS